MSAHTDIAPVLCEDVSFTYPGDGITALDGGSLEVRQGEFVALAGMNGSGKSTLISRVAARAVECGMDVELFHCSLNPASLEHLVIPSIGTAIITSVEPHEWTASPDSAVHDVIIDMEQCLDPVTVRRNHDIIEYDRRLMHEAMSRAVYFLGEARHAHHFLGEPTGAQDGQWHEIPFDFTRRRMSVVVAQLDERHLLITKGAVEEILAVCTQVRHGAALEPLTPELLARIRAVTAELNEEGLRVVAVAVREGPPTQQVYGVADECQLTLVGYVAFLDPPKDSTAAALKAPRSGARPQPTPGRRRSCAAISRRPGCPDAPPNRRGPRRSSTRPTSRRSRSD